MKPMENEQPETAVYDRGRRGNPLQGCDCVQCFGYCLIDGDEALREKMATGTDRDAAIEILGSAA